MGKESCGATIDSVYYLPAIGIFIDNIKVAKLVRLSMPVNGKDNFISFSGASLCDGDV